MGTTLLRHGQYNFTGFCAAWVPAFILFIMIKMWLLINKIIPTRVAIGFLVGLVTVSFVYWEYASARALESWNKGLFDELSYEMEMCNIRLEGVPWASILPNKFFNFFTGSDECPEIEVFSSVGTDGMLSVNCS